MGFGNAVLASLFLFAVVSVSAEDAPLRLVPAFLDYRNHSGPTPKRSIVEMVGSGVCVIDYDVDGLPDLYFPDGGAPGIDARNRLYRNRGGLSFEDMTAQAGVGPDGWGGGCAVADIDNDGDPDLYLTNTGPNVLYRNNGDGTFDRIEETAAVDHPIQALAQAPRSGISMETVSPICTSATTSTGSEPTSPPAVVISAWRSR